MKKGRKMIKIDKAKFKNFCQFEDFELAFDDRITRLVGLNGAGKSTVGLKGLMACINGISEQSGKGQLIGERFRFIGKAGKSADVEYTFADSGRKFTIRNHITAGTNSITFQAESGDIDDSWLKGFLNVALMSAKNFCALTPKQQAVALGIDTSTFDAESKAFKQEFTMLNRDLKAFGEPAPVDPVDPVDLSKLLTQKGEIRARLNAQYMENKKRNAATNAAREAHEEKQIEIGARLATAKTTLEALRELGYAGAEVETWIGTLPIPAPWDGPPLIEEMPDDAELRAIDDRIAQAGEVNASAAAYRDYGAKITARDAKRAEIEKNRAAQETAAAARTAYIAGRDFGFAGLSTDEEGSLLLNGRPISESYYSKGELEMIVARLHESQNPVFKCRFIDDFNLLDEANQEKIITELNAAGFQVIVAEVGSGSDKENSIVLRECAIATAEEERPKLL
jgi:hypothetical protein